MLDVPFSTPALEESRASAPAAAIAASAPHGLRQGTLGHAVSCSGVGLHTGQKTDLKLMPAPAGSGIVFVRTDITDRDNVVPALYSHVVDSKLCTVLSNAAGTTVSTVEHLMAALWACGIDNARIEINGAEVPIMDGSAAPFLFLIECAGWQEHAAARQVIKIQKKISLTEGEKSIELAPAKEFQIYFEIDFAASIIASQTMRFGGAAASFKSDIARARTFGFRHEVDMLRQMGLARGGSLDNAIVVDGDKILNREGLRYRDEFVRHKVLDCVGDLYLAGKYIVGSVDAIRSGHALNNAALRALFADAENYQIVPAHAA